VLIAPLRSGDEVARAAAPILRPPRRITPTQAAAGKLRNDRGAWDPLVTPYLIEPLDRLADRLYQGVVFVGPARTGKTFGLPIAGIYYAVTVAPADILAIYMSQDTARDFSRMELDRAIANTPELAALMSPRARDDNTYDKFFRNGIALKIGWPAATQLRGKTVRYVFLMDYDGGGSVNVDGRGSLWGQAFKRITTYLSRGKCFAESSPGFEYDDPTWTPRTPHEAPPAVGIASLYNTGTRARWYWACRHCAQHFEAKPGLVPFLVPEFEEVIEAVRTHDLMTLAESWAKVACTHCGGIHEPHEKVELNALRQDGDRIAGAAWVHEGQQLVDGRLEGEPRRTNVASYWLGGAGAAYQPWISIVHTYLTAAAEYARTGDETELRRTSFEDQGWPYMPMAVRRTRTPEQFAGRLEDWERGTCPDGVRFLTAFADVQAHAFVIHVMGWGVGLQSWLIDRFRITSSRRPEGERFEALDPAVYLEDWHELIPRLVDASYPCASHPEYRLRPMITGADSGGKEGVTLRAYDFYRHLRALQQHQRFRLVKGEGNLNAPLVQLSYPDSRGRKDRDGGRGDVPVMRLNVNQLKDGIAGDLAREVPGPGYCHIPRWVDEGYFSEVTAEKRTAKGWERDGHTPNEGFDLHAYNRAGCAMLKAHAIDWDNPPDWAAPIERQIELANPPKGTPTPQPRGRRVRSEGVRV
jgi:phage terminase large subunit GpA-like protein